MKKWIFGALLLFLINGVSAQASLGFASHATPGLADTVIKSSNITYGVTVLNTGTQPFTGNFKVMIAVLDTSLMFPVQFDSVTVTTNSMLAGDSVLVTITHNVDPLYFMDGNNTVVIWPAANGYQTTDTIFKDVFVIDFQEIDEFADNQLIIYPNPTSDYLYIKTNSTLEKVRILNLEGKEIFVSDQPLIDLSNYENGLYFIELKTEDGKLIRKKIMVGR